MSTATSLRTSTSTRTQTAVHLTDVITGAFSAIVASLGLSSAHLRSHWNAIEHGLMTWIDEGSLKDVSLEFGNPAAPIAVFEIPILYRFTGAGNVEFVASRARLARLTAKLQRVPSNTSYRVVANHHGSYTDVPGWSAATAADRSSLASYRLGGLGSGPDASASLVYHHRRA